MGTSIDRQELTLLIREILREDPTIVLDALKDARDEAQRRRAEIDAIIDRDFTKYDEVFRALA